MSTSTYITYECDTCKRSTQILLDGRRPDPNRCNITLKCRGHLKRMGASSSKKFLFTPTMSGVDNYSPRFTTVNNLTSIPVTPQVTIFTSGGGGMATIACPRVEVDSSNNNFYVVDSGGNRFDLESRISSSSASSYFNTPIASTVTLSLFEITPKLLEFKMYTYVRGYNAQLITGTDDSSGGLKLVFNENNSLKVYVNGIMLPDSAYDRSVNNQLTLTPALTEINNTITILVYTKLSTLIPQSSLISLTFRGLNPDNSVDLALRDLCCWGNCEEVFIEGTTRSLLYCTDFASLDRNKSYGISSITATSEYGETREIDPGECFILLGQEPFAFQDKETYAYVRGSEIVTSDSTNAIITYNQSQATGNLEPVIGETFITQVFNAIQPRSPVTITKNTAQAVITTNGTEILNRRYILGPS